MRNLVRLNRIIIPNAFKTCILPYCCGAFLDGKPVPNWLKNTAEPCRSSFAHKTNSAAFAKWDQAALHIP
jgi:hypothetical protein